MMASSGSYLQKSFNYWVSHEMRPKETTSCCKTYLAPLTPLQPDLFSWRPKILHRHSLASCSVSHLLYAVLHLVIISNNGFLIRIWKKQTSSVLICADSKHFSLSEKAPWLQWKRHFSLKDSWVLLQESHMDGNCGCWITSIRWKTVKQEFLCPPDPSET